jgi:hypothetical protein
MSHPEFGEREALAGKGDLALGQVLATAMAGLSDEPITSRSPGLAHQLHEKGVGQRKPAEPCETNLPVVDPTPLTRPFACAGQISLTTEGKRLF